MPTPEPSHPHELPDNEKRTTGESQENAGEGGRPSKPRVELPKNPRPPAQSQLDRERAEGEGMTSPTSDR